MELATGQLMGVSDTFVALRATCLVPTIGQ
jgi:hypothetical protein